MKVELFQMFLTGISTKCASNFWMIMRPQVAGSYLGRAKGERISDDLIELTLEFYIIVVFWSKSYSSLLKKQYTLTRHHLATSLDKERVGLDPFV